MEFRLPDVGEGIHEAEIVRWLVQEGERVREFDAIVEVQTDKAVVELPAPAAGYIQEIRLEAGRIARVGDVLVIIQSQNAFAGLTERGDGEKHRHEAGHRTTVSVSQTSAPEHVQGSVVRAESPLRPRATPAVRYYARQKQVSLYEVIGTGPGERILKEDIDNAAHRKLGERDESGRKPQHDVPLDTHSPLLRALQTHTMKYASQSQPRQGNPDDDSLRRPVYESPDAKIEPGRARESTKVPFRGIRRATAEHVTRSAFSAPHVTAFDDCDAGELVALRNRWNHALESQGQRISYLPFIIKATVSALKKFPYFNAKLNEGEQVIELLPDYHIGIAMDTSDGLIVPVVRHADGLSLREIGEEIYRLTQGAKQRTLKKEDLRGSTFTITNTGPIGGLFATPILNHPEVGILAVHQIQRKPVVRDEEIVIRDILTLSLSFDHRVIDGATAVRFMNCLKELIEQPELLMLELK